jgi:hypothetical protein
LLCLFFSPEDESIISTLNFLESMRIAGYDSVCVQLYCVSFHCFTTCFGLHGHRQMCRIFYFHMLEGFCFAAFFAFFSRGHTLNVSICGVGKIRGIIICCLCYFWYCYMCVFTSVFLFVL